MYTSTLGNDDVEISARDAVYRGYLGVDAYRLRHRRHGNMPTTETVR